jgi:hypothetical protein
MIFWCLQIKLCLQIALRAEHELEAVLLGIRIPVRPVPPCLVFGFVLYLARWYPESDRLVRFSSNLVRDVSGEVN